MNHPKVSECLAALDDARTALVDALKSPFPFTEQQRADLRSRVDGINDVILEMPHVQVPNV